MKRMVVLLLLLLPTLSWGAGSKTAGDWHEYISFSGGGRTFGHTACIPSQMSPGIMVRMLNDHTNEYVLVDRVVVKNKPIVVDIVRPSTSQIIRCVRSLEKCNQVRNADMSGAMEMEQIDRYR